MLGSVRLTPPPSWWRATSCAKCIQHYFRAYSARLIADNGFCEVYPTLAAKLVVFFDPPGSGIMNMSLKVSERSEASEP